ncbi:MAG: TolC family protein [Alphaproteobacteria bacterium]|nr:TolC family protein [Alphaproteobacteria bacterium]
MTMNICARLAASVGLVALVAACAVTPERLTDQDMTTATKANREKMFATTARLDRPLTLDDAIARAMAHNLDHRARLMEEVLALGQLDVDRYDMLPQLAASAGYSWRNEPAASVSRSLATGATSLEASYSTERTHTTWELGTTWSVLDFGVSWFNARQNADRALIAGERRRKVANNLIQEVRSAWWRAASAQKLEGDVAQATQVARGALDDTQRVERENLRAPIDALRVQRGLLENLRQLETIRQDLITAKTELAALVNLPPGTQYQVDIPADDAMLPAPWAMALDEMEYKALLNNPDLREEVYQGRVTAHETRKAVLRLLPGISLQASRNYDSNDLTVFNHWTEAGPAITTNLFNMISAPSRIRFAQTGEKVAQAKQLALQMAVLTQVNVAKLQYEMATRQFELADQIWRVDQRISDHSTNRQAADAQGKVEQVANATSSIVGLLRRYQAVSQLHAAVGRMQASVGWDPLRARSEASTAKQVTAEVDKVQESGLPDPVVWLGKLFQ